MEMLFINLRQYYSILNETILFEKILTEHSLATFLSKFSAKKELFIHGTSLKNLTLTVIGIRTRQQNY